MLRPHTKTVVIAGILTIATSSQGLLTTASKTNGEYNYNFSTVPLLAEILKLAISVVLLNRQRKTAPEIAKVTVNARTTLLFAVPSIIYWLHNNVQFLTLQYVDPATYQILGNLKIVTTGLLSWIILRRRVSPLQWIALVLLSVGATTSQLNTCTDQSTFAAPAQGYVFGLLSAVLSAVAAIYTEWAMKRNADSLYWQNIQLYSLGICFNALGLTLRDAHRGFPNGLWTAHILDGYNLVTFAVVANLAFSGLLVSWVTKFADSIMKVYATSMAMFVTMAISVALFGLRLSLQLLLGITTASISLVLYYINPTMLTATPADSRGTEPSPRAPSSVDGIIVKSAISGRGPLLDRKMSTADQD